MKKSLRHILFLAVLVVSLCCLLAVVSSAAETEAGTIGEFKTAVESASAGDTVTVTATLNVTSDTTVTAPAAVTVNFTGSGSVFSVSNASLTLSGPMSISATVPCVLTSGTTSSVTMSNGLSVTATCLVQVNSTSTNTVNISGTTYTVGGTAAYCIGTAYSSSATDVSITLGEGNTITTSQMILHSVASGTTSYTINGGTYTATSNNAIYFRSGGKQNNLTMTAGTVTQSGSNNLISVTGSVKNDISISGGTLAVTPAKYAMYLNGANTTVSISNDAKINVTGAQVAIYSAVASSITISDTAKITSGGMGIQFAAAGGSLTMTGGTIESANSGVRVAAATTLTFSGTANVNAKTSNPAIHCDYKGPTETAITVSGGTFYSKAHYAIYLSSSGGASWPHYALNITGGTFKSDAYGAIGSRWSSYTRGTISGGTFQTTKSGQAAFNITDTSDCDVTVIGGTFISDTAAFASSSTTAGALRLYGGSMRAPLTASYTTGGHSITVGKPAVYEVPSGHNAVAALEIPDNTLYKRSDAGLTITATYNGSGTPTFSADDLIYHVPYCVATKDDVDTPYATLKDAIGSAEAGSTIRISRDVFIPYTLPTITKELTLVGDGVTLTGPSGSGDASVFFNLGVNGNLTVGAGVSIISPAFRTIQFLAASTDASLTVNGGTVQSITNSPIVVYGTNPSVTIASGTVIAGASVGDTTGGYYGIFVTTTTNANITVSGGTLYGRSNGMYVNTGAAGANVTVSGGTVACKAGGCVIYSVVAGTNATNGAHITVSGGTVAPYEEISGSGYAVQLKGAYGTLTVSGTGSLRAGYRTVTVEQSNCTVNVNGGMITCYGTGNYDSFVIYKDLSAIAFNMTSGAIESNRYGVYQMSDTTYTISGGTITTTGVAFNQYNNAGTQIPNETILRITGLTLNSPQLLTTISVSNTIEVSGLTAHATGSGALIYAGASGTIHDVSVTLGADNDVTVAGGVVYVNPGAGVDPSASVTITGGTLNGTGDYVLYTATDTGTINVYGGTISGRIVTDVAGSAINIYGGTFTRAEGSADLANANAGTINVYGGTFTLAGDTGTVFTAGSGTLNMAGGFVIKGGEKPLADVDYADANKIYTGDKIITRDTGAAVRMQTVNPGLRFVSHIDAATKAFVEGIADTGTIKYYTIIFPANHLATLNGDVTPANIMATLTPTRQYVKVLADEGIVSDGADGIYIRTALINIKDYTRDFACVAYIEYEVNGNTMYQSTVFNSTNDVRNIQDVAAAALADPMGTYNAAQRAILEEFANNDGPTTVAMFAALPAPAGKKYL